MTTKSVVLLIVILAGLLLPPSVTLAQGPAPAGAAPGWWVTKFVPTELYDRSWTTTQGWTVQSAGWGRYMGRSVQGYWLIKWFTATAPAAADAAANSAASLGGMSLAPAYSYSESRNRVFCGQGWRYNPYTGRCYILN